MNCWSCGFPNLIWGGDNECPEDFEYEIETNLTCPRCEAFVLVYHQLKPEYETRDQKINGNVVSC